VILVDCGAAPPPGTLDWSTLVARAADAFEIAPTDPEQPALLHFTSGTTGTPKGALHVHGAPWSRTTRPPGTRSTCTRTTSCGVPPIPAR